MANKPSAALVAAKAVERLRGAEIPYDSEDCQKFIKTCINLCGGNLSSGGTNDIYRNHCFEVSVFDPTRPGDTRPGDMLFICELNGEEPARFQGDGVGNVNHIGVYCGVEGAEVVHSSQSRGKVAASTIHNAWNRRGRLSCLDYESDREQAPQDHEAPAPSAATPEPGQVLVNTQETGAYLRRQPKIVNGANHNRICEVPKGSILAVLDRRDGWTKVSYSIHAGWIRDDMLKFG